MPEIGEQKPFYNEELECEALYTRVQRLRQVRVRDLDDLIVLHYYWQDAQGELWSDFDDPMENAKRDFIVYRKAKGYLTPEQIDHLRKNAGLTLRRFAAYLNLGLSTLSQLTNNLRVQTPQQENLLKLVNDYFNRTGHLPRLNAPNQMAMIQNRISTAAKLIPATDYGSNLSIEFTIPQRKTTTSEAI